MKTDFTELLAQGREKKLLVPVFCCAYPRDMFVLKKFAHILGFILVGCLVLSAGVRSFGCEENGDDTEWERQSGWQEYKKKEEQF